MANAFASRFQLVVDELASGNKKKFAELTHKSASHVYKICRGISRPSMTYLQHLYDEYHIDLTWLLTGEQGDNSAVTGRANSGDLVYAPIFDVQASAGFGVDVVGEDVDDYFAFNKNWLSRQLGISSESLLFVSVRGDSMEPTVQDADHVLVDMTQRQVHREGIFLLQTQDGLMVKRLKVKSKGVIDVISDNPHYASWELILADQAFNPINGRVVWSARAL